MPPGSFDAANLWSGTTQRLVLSDTALPLCIHALLLFVADAPHPTRQYAGLALVVIAYVGGIIGWSCAVLNASSPTTSGPEDNVKLEALHYPPPASVVPSQKPGEARFDPLGLDTPPILRINAHYPSTVKPTDNHALITNSRTIDASPEDKALFKPLLNPGSVTTRALGETERE